MNELLLDTDMLSLFLRNQPKVMSAANDYLKFHPGFTFSVVTHFEVLRGLKVKGAQIQIEKFALICAKSKELNLTALETGLAIATNNESHFNRISGLRVVNWNR